MVLSVGMAFRQRVIRSASFNQAPFNQALARAQALARVHTQITRARAMKWPKSGQMFAAVPKVMLSPGARDLYTPAHSRQAF
jgi:hypothetical protein